MARQRLTDFIRAHPVCCFCGGKRATTSRDHQPARIFFRGKRMPDDSVYPACQTCQHASREAENAASIIVSPGEISDSDRAARLDRIAYHRRNRPGMIEDLILDDTEKRHFMTELGMELPSGLATADVPMLKLNASTWHPHFEILSKKLILALHYRRFQQPLSQDGRMLTGFTFNAHVMNTDFLDEVTSYAEHLHLPKHGNESLGDQMAVRWNADPEHLTAVFVASLHGIFYVHGITCDDPEWLELLEEEGPDGPETREFRRPLP